MTRPSVLYLDTTSARLMVGVSVEDRMVFRFSESATSQRYHSAILVPTLQQALAESALAPADLGALALNIGPGSFTGIRTGLVTARMMAQFLDLPIHALSTFDLIAAACPGETVAVYLDALQGNAYHACLHDDDYRDAPALVRISDTLPPAGAIPVVSRSLSSLFMSPRILEEMALFTPKLMQSLIHRHGNRFLRPWAEVSALYLQEPNITLRKPQAGTLK